MSIKKRNWSRLAELRHFTLQNIMFSLAVLAFSVVLFNLTGGWGAIGMSGFSSTWLAWAFFGVTCFMILLLIISALKWLCSKGPFYWISGASRSVSSSWSMSTTMARPPQASNFWLHMISSRPASSNLQSR